MESHEIRPDLNRLRDISLQLQIIVFTSCIYRIFKAPFPRNHKKQMFAITRLVNNIAGIGEANPAL